jgi:DNA-binding XRE family transcriptional regulator
MMPVDYAMIGERIRHCRKAQKITQEQLAERAEVSPSFLGHIERGTRKASVETIVHIADALGVCLCVLIPLHHADGQAGEYKLLVNDICELIQTRTGGHCSHD